MFLVFFSIQSKNKIFTLNRLVLVKFDPRYIFAFYYFFSCTGGTYVHSMQLDKIKNPLKIKEVSFEKCCIIYSTDLSEVSVSVSAGRGRPTTLQYHPHIKSRWDFVNGRVAANSRYNLVFFIGGDGMDYHP